MSEEILKSIDNRLSSIVKILSFSIIKGKPLNESIELLYNAGLTPADIASILGKTPNNIRVQIHLLKKKMKSKSQKASGMEVDANG